MAVFSAWAAVTVMTFLYLSFSGYPAPAARLFFLRGGIPRGGLALAGGRVRALCAGAGLYGGTRYGAGGQFLVLVLGRTGALELFAVVLAVCTLVLEWAAWRELR